MNSVNVCLLKKVVYLYNKSPNTSNNLLLMLYLNFMWNYRCNLALFLFEPK